MRVGFRPLLVVAVLAVAMPARAATVQDCPLVPDIVSAASFLLTDPKTERRFWRDHVSTDAAYLLIRYGGLSEAHASALVETLRQRRVAPERIQDLRLALAPPDRRLALLDDMQEGASTPPGGPAFFRAMILDGRADWLFGEMARRAAIAGADSSAIAQFQIRLAASLIDLDDARLAEIAARAEARGLWTLALELLAARSEPAAWLDALRRSPMAPANADRLREAFAPYWRGFRHLRPRPYRFEDLPAELKIAAASIDLAIPSGARDLDATFELAALVPQTRAILTIVNQTGDLRIGRDVARPLVTEVRDRRLDAVRDADLIEARMLEGLVAVLGEDITRRNLESFRLHGPPPTETALQSAERAVAITALAPFASGNAGEAPARPVILSRNFDWAGWRNAAEAIRNERDVFPSYRAIAADLLHRIGRHQQAIDGLAAIGQTDEARRIGHAMLMRLDRLCAGLIWPSPVLGDPIYRFDPR